MIRLQQTFGAHTGRVLSFDQDVGRFGRLPECECAFDPQADLDASGKHAEARREQGRWWIVDVGSRNGTLLNGQRVTRAPLSSGDEIEFGPGGPRVRIELPPAAPAASPAAGAWGAPPAAQPSSGGALQASTGPAGGAFGGPGPGAIPMMAAMTPMPPASMTPGSGPMPSGPMLHDALNASSRDYTGPMTPVGQGGPAVPA